MSDTWTPGRVDIGGTHETPIPAFVRETVEDLPGGREWLAGIPAAVSRLRELWSLRIDEPFEGGSCSWVAPARLPDGSRVVLKLSCPHAEAAGEAEALRVWDGRGSARLLAHEPRDWALLLERCDPGVELRRREDLSPEDRIAAAAQVLSSLWQAAPSRPGDGGSGPVPPADGGPASTIADLARVAAEWSELTGERMARLRPPLDPGLVEHGIRLLQELAAGAQRAVILHGDFNPGNILSAERLPWLAIDAKPMIGDPAYDPWPLVQQVDDPFRLPDPAGAIARRFALVAQVTGQDAARMAAWGVARRVETALACVQDGELADAQSVMAEARTLADVIGL